MSFGPLNPFQTLLSNGDSNILSGNTQSGKYNSIKRGMTVNQISDIVSEDFINSVKRQFDFTKKKISDSSSKNIPRSKPKG